MDGVQKQSPNGNSAVESLLKVVTDWEFENRYDLLLPTLRRLSILKRGELAPAVPFVKTLIFQRRFSISPTAEGKTAEETNRWLLETSEGRETWNLPNKENKIYTRYIGQVNAAISVLEKSANEDAIFSLVQIAARPEILGQSGSERALDIIRKIILSSQKKSKIAFKVLAKLTNEDAPEIRRFAFGLLEDELIQSKILPHVNEKNTAPITNFLDTYFFEGNCKKNPAHFFTALKILSATNDERTLEVLRYYLGVPTPFNALSEKAAEVLGTLSKREIQLFCRILLTRPRLSSDSQRSLLKDVLQTKIDTLTYSILKYNYMVMELPIFIDFAIKAQENGCLTSRKFKELFSESTVVALGPSYRNDSELENNLSLLLKNKNHLIRKLAINAISRIGFKHIANSVGEVAINKKEDPSTRLTAIEILGKIRSLESIPLLLQLSTDYHPVVISSVFKSLVSFGPRGIVKIRDQLNDLNLPRRQIAAKAIANMISSAPTISLMSDKKKAFFCSKCLKELSPEGLEALSTEVSEFSDAIRYRFSALLDPTSTIQTLFDQRLIDRLTISNEDYSEILKLCNLLSDQENGCVTSQRKPEDMSQALAFPKQPLIDSILRFRQPPIVVVH